VSRGAVAAAGVLSAGLLVAAVLATPPRGDPALARFPSVRSTSGPGVGAAARWLTATGRPHRVILDDAEPPRPGEVWLLLAPAEPLGDRQVTAVVDHAAAGGLVVWALGEAGEARQPALARRLAARRLPAGGPARPHVAGTHPLFDGLTLPAGGGGVASDAPGARAVLGDPGRPAAVAIPVGLGEVVLLPGPELLDNRHVGQGDALSLWVRLAARGPLAFDERRLRPAAAGLVERSSPPVLLALQLGLLVLLLAAAAWPRLGAVRPPPPAGTGRTTHDYLASLADLYRRAGAEPELAAATWGRLRRRLEREAGVAAGLPAEEAALRLAAGAPAAAEPLRRGAAALARGGPGLLLEVARAAADVEASRRRRGR
jgi:hypothetical protein